MRRRDLAGLAAMLAMPAAARAQNTTGAQQADLARLLGVLQTQHPNPYKAHTAAEWQALHAELAAGLANGDAEAGIIAAMRLTAFAADGHTTAAAMPMAGAPVPPGFDLAYPARIEFLAEGAYVTAAAPHLAAGLAQARVTHVGSAPIGEALARITPLIGAENPMKTLSRAPGLLQNPGVLAALGMVRSATGPLSLTVSPPSSAGLLPVEISPLPRGAAETAMVPLLPKGAPTPLYLRSQRAYSLEYLAASKTLYVNYTAAREEADETMAGFAARLTGVMAASPVDRLVLDLRRNGGGNNYLNQPLVHALIGAPANRRGHLFVITGRTTFSAGMSMAADVERNCHAIFVGEPTGAGPNHYGDATPTDLPGLGVRAMISTVFWESSDPHDKRQWILPDIPAPPTFAALWEGRDVAMEAIEAWPGEAVSGDRPPNANWLRGNQAGGWGAYRV